MLDMHSDSTLAYTMHLTPVRPKIAQMHNLKEPEYTAEDDREHLGQVRLTDTPTSLDQQRVNRHMVGNHADHQTHTADPFLHLPASLGPQVFAARQC